MSIQRLPTRRPGLDPILDGPVAAITVSVELRDWKRSHRALSEGRREAAREYITTIIRRDILLRSSSAEEQQAYADGLWRRFRELYDELHHAEHEDFVRALARL